MLLFVGFAVLRVYQKDKPFALLFEAFDPSTIYYAFAASSTVSKFSCLLVFVLHCFVFGVFPL